MSATRPMHVQINLVGPQCIQVRVGFDEPTWHRQARVHDVEQALDKLEGWLWPPKSGSDPYKVAVSVIGLEGAIQETVWPNRYLALYFIAKTLAHAVPAEPMRRWLAIPNFVQHAE